MIESLPKDDLNALPGQATTDSVLPQKDLFVPLDPGLRIAPDDDGWIDDDSNYAAAERPPTSIDDQFRSHALDPEETGRIREGDGFEPINEEAFAAWFAALPVAEQQELMGGKQAIAEQRRRLALVHERLMATVPELYVARLPAALEVRLGNMPYALGFNQSGVSSIQEAEMELEAKGGIAMLGYADLGERFVMCDAWSMDVTWGDPGLESAIDQGFYRQSGIGRFVTAFPVVDTEGMQLDKELTGAIQTDHHRLPDDMKVPLSPIDGKENWAVSAKYVAGFIDEDGLFWENRNFTTSTEPDFYPVAERPQASLPDYPPEGAGQDPNQRAEDWL